MKKLFSLQYSYELLFALISFAAILAVLETFLIGKHYIIPSVILVIAVVCGNLAWWGFQNKVWAKYLLFWSGFLFTCHAFFALFFSVKYRDLLGSYFEITCTTIVVILVFLTIQYARRNLLFQR
jgi:hypothetical protein